MKLGESKLVRVTICRLPVFRVYFVQIVFYRVNILSSETGFFMVFFLHSVLSLGGLS